MLYYGYWVAFFLLIVFFVFLDLGILHKKPRVITIGEALLWTLFWVSLALLFNLAVYYIYEHGSIMDSSLMIPKSGKEAALQFFTGYLIEESLSLDNVFVISLIFSYYRIPLKFQHRVLVWGILSAAILRGVLILFGTSLVQSFSWILYVFGLFLLLSGLRLLFYEGGTKISEDNAVIKLARRFFPVSNKLEHQFFFIRENGVLMMTPLFLALLQVETADVVFAVDSIPAIFAITLDPFIVYTSNIFAIFGMRSLYFTLAPLIQRFRYLKFSLSLILVFIGAKMLMVDFYKIPNLYSLFIISALLMGGVIFSLTFPEGSKFSLKFPMQGDIGQLFIFTLKQAKKIVVFVIGTTVLLFGVLLLFLPGPAFIVIPLGVLILSTEFVWAKRFLDKIKKYSSNLTNNNNNSNNNNNNNNNKDQAPPQS
jgi:tellurite resistance protein TerC